MAIPDFMGSSNQSLDICDPGYKLPLTLKDFLVTVARSDCFILPLIKDKMAVFFSGISQEAITVFSSISFNL